MVELLPLPEEHLGTQVQNNSKYPRAADNAANELRHPPLLEQHLPIGVSLTPSSGKRVE